MRNLAFVLSGLIVLGCSDDSAKSPNSDELLEPPAQGEGVQIKMVSQLAAGTETERCMFYQVPAEGLYVNREQVKYKPGSHHVLLWTTAYTAIPTKDELGQAITADANGVFDCAEGPTAKLKTIALAGGSQVADGPAIVANLPADVAFKLEANTVLIVDAHYVNATEAPLDTDVRINLFTIAKELVKQEAGVLFFYDLFITVPANGTASAHAACPIRSDITLLNGQSHMHRRGAGYVANLLDDKGEKIQEIYKTSAWADIAAKPYDPGVAIKAGSAIEWNCDYNNTESHAVMQGLKSTDEMCMFIGLYYPLDLQTQFCALDNTYQTAFLSANWIGTGDKTCLETAQCVGAAKPPAMDQGESLFSCVTNSCAKAATETSNVLRCEITFGFGQCAETCTSGGDCSKCIQEKCAAQFQACAMATCE